MLISVSVPVALRIPSSANDSVLLSRKMLPVEWSCPNLPIANDPFVMERFARLAMPLSRNEIAAPRSVTLLALSVPLMRKVMLPPVMSMSWTLTMPPAPNASVELPVMSTSFALNLPLEPKAIVLAPARLTLTALNVLRSPPTMWAAAVAVTFSEVSVASSPMLIVPPVMFTLPVVSWPLGPVFTVPPSTVRVEIVSVCPFRSKRPSEFTSTVEVSAIWLSMVSRTVAVPPMPSPTTSGPRIDPPPGWLSSNSPS